MTLKQWRARVWQVADSKGWHDRERSWPEIRALVVSELSEALEEHRAGRMLAWYPSPAGPVVTVGFLPRGFKPEGFPIEIADAAIRLLDYAETLGLEWDDEDEPRVLAGETDTPWPTNVVEQIDAATAVLHGDFSSTDLLVWLGLRTMFSLAAQHDFDLLKCIALKTEYNRTRPYMHGKVA